MNELIKKEKKPAHNTAYSLWRVNGLQQGFRSVASFGFGGQESALKPPQAICKTLITARNNNILIGVARSLTDYMYCTYLSDLAVDQAYQKQGIGKELIRKIKLETPKAKLILLSAPKAVGYYPKIGMKQWENCYCIDYVDELI